MKDLAKVMKVNPYHDRMGLFSSKDKDSDGKASSSLNPDQRKAVAGIASEMKDAGIKVKMSGNTLTITDSVSTGNKGASLDARLKDWNDPSGTYNKYFAGMGVKVSATGTMREKAPTDREDFTVAETKLTVTFGS